MDLLRLVICWIVVCAAARAGTLTQADVARRFPAPVPGFAGVPPNLLVVIDPKGVFLDVEVLAQHEPVFLEGLGETPLRDFLRQYRGRSLGEGITVCGGKGSLDGVSKATASVRIGRIRMDWFAPMSLPVLLEAGLVRHVRVSNRDVERLFARGAGAGLDAQALAHPNGVFVDVWVAWASVPAVGRNLLAPRTWNRLQERLDPGDHALLVMTAGPHPITGDDFVPGSVPRRAECGMPCQTCRHRCGYNAIAASGTIVYEECFQCMECVVIHAGDEQCAPRILERKRGRSIPIAPASVIIDRRA